MQAGEESGAPRLRHVRPPEAGKTGVAILRFVGQRIGITDGVAHRGPGRWLGTGDLEHGFVCVQRQHGRSTTRDARRPVAGAAGNFEHPRADKQARHPFAQHGEISLPFGLGVDALVLCGALRVVGPEVGVGGHAMDGRPAPGGAGSRYATGMCPGFYASN